MPVLVIDCESKDGSFEHFKAMMQSHSFDLLSAPLKPHGLTLDWLFASIQADNVLLIDSDAEILNGAILEIMEDAMKDFADAVKKAVLAAKSVAYSAGASGAGNGLPSFFVIHALLSFCNFRRSSISL
jgi:hypothetical protein